MGNIKTVVNEFFLKRHKDRSFDVLECNFFNFFPLFCRGVFIRLLSLF